MEGDKILSDRKVTICYSLRVNARPGSYSYPTLLDPQIEKKNKKIKDRLPTSPCVVAKWKENNLRFGC